MVYGVENTDKNIIYQTVRKRSEHIKKTNVTKSVGINDMGNFELKPALYKAQPQGPATRCDEMGHFAAILKLLEPSQTIAAHRRYLLQKRSSVASQLPTMECFHILLRCSSQR